MAGINGPKIVTTGLVLALDAADKKSYPGSGTSWFDISGNGYLATLTTTTPADGTPVYSSLNGGAMYFDRGYSQYINTNFTAGNIDLTANFSFDVWCYIIDVGSGPQVALLDFSNGATYSTNYAGNTLWFNNYNIEFRNMGDAVNGNKVTFSIPYNSYYHFVFVRSGSTFYAYKNGVSQGSNTYTNRTVNSAAKYTLGSRLNGGGDFFRGYIFNTRFYNKALSASEILQNFNATRGRFGI